MSVSPAPALNRSELRTLSLASLGGMLEFYDFVIFAFFAKNIAQNFFSATQPLWLSQTETFGLFGAGYLARPLGGVIMAHFGDTSGRKRMFTFSVMLMAIPTLLMGLLPGFATLGIMAPLVLLVLRVMQGAAIGGEAPGGWVFVAEHARPGKTGLALGMLTAGLTAGILLGSLVALGVHSLIKQQQAVAWGWRIPFLLGGIFGLISVYLRRWLEETPVFKEMHQSAAVAKSMPVSVILRDFRPSVLLSIIGTWTLTSTIVVPLLMMPALLQTLYHFPAAATLNASLLASVFLTASVLMAGIATDRWGLKASVIPAVIVLIAGTFGLFGVAPQHPALLLPLACLSGLGSAVVGLVPVAMIGAFPARVRFSGLSLSYNVSYAIFGGMTPVIVSALVRAYPLAPFFYVAVSAICGGAALWFLADSNKHKANTLASTLQAQETL